MEIRLLGPIEVWTADGAVEAGGPRQLGVLAALAADVNRTLPTETLLDRVWGEEAPAAARHGLHAYIARLRKVLGHDGSARLLRRSGGYVLEADPDRVDVARFRRLVEAARRPGLDPAERATLLRQAAKLWRGTPLAGLPGAWAAQAREGWSRQRLDTVLTWSAAELDRGATDTVIEELHALTAEYPLSEPLTGALMQALQAAGRGSEALDRYAALRTRLADELGCDPGPEVQGRYLALIRSAPAVTPPRAARRETVPAQLPMDIAGFTGREPALERLDALLTGPGPTVAVVHGTAGVGKTALVVRWAHRAAAHFADGQLYVNLRGYGPEGGALSATEAFRGFFDALDVPAKRVPPAVDGQAALFRSAVAGRRMLIVLDNARDAAQVRPLLPGGGTCVVVVTSREYLGPLVAMHGAVPVPLGLMSTVEARAMLSVRLGAERVAAEPEAVEEVATACARLPLALAIAAARAWQSGFTLGHLATELRDTARRLDLLDAGDDSSRVRAVFRSSYAAVSPAAARLFRLLGRHPGPDISVEAAQSLAGGPVGPALSELTRAHLLIEPAPRRYTFHDLLRAYAAEMPADDESNALRRMLDHYAHTATSASRLLDPHRIPLRLSLEPPAGDARVPVLAGHDAAMAWLSAEHRVLLAVQRRSVEWPGCDAYACHLAWALDTFLNRRGQWVERVVVWETALAAAERLGDAHTRAHAHRALAHAHTLIGAFAEAKLHYGHALGFYARAGDRAGQAYTHRNLAQLAARQQDAALAITHAGLALKLFEEAGDRHGQALALNGLGWYHVQAGDSVLALRHCEKALALNEELGDRVGQANTLDSLGLAHHHAGQYAEAIDRYRRSLVLVRELGDRHEEAMTLARLGDTHLADGDAVAARGSWRAALGILEDLCHPDAAGVRARLAPHRPL